MNRKKSLIQNTFIIAIGRASSQALSFFLLPLYTSLLSTEQYGNFDLLNTLSLFIIPFVSLLMEESMFRFLIDAKDDNDKAKIESQTIIFTLISMFIWAFIIYFGGNYFFNYQYSGYLVIYVAASILSTLAGSLARGSGEFKIYSAFAFFSSIITIIFNIIFIVLFKMDERGLFIAYAIGNSAVSIWLLLRLKAHKMVRFKNIDKGYIKEMVKYSLPLIPSNLSWITINLSDRLVIVAKLGTALNGIYSTATKFPSIINTFYNFFYLAWKESASQALKEENPEGFYNEIYLNLKGFLISGSLLILGALPFVFNFFIKGDFRGCYVYIPILIIAIFYNNMSSFCGGIFAAYKKNSIMAISSFIAAIVNLVVDISLMGKIGLYAAAVSTLISALIVFYYRKIKLKEFIKLVEDKNLIYHILMFALLCTSFYIRNYIFCGFTLLCAIGYSYYLNKSLINKILIKLKLKKS